MKGQVLQSYRAMGCRCRVGNRARALAREESGVLAEKSPTADPSNPLSGLLW